MATVQSWANPWFLFFNMDLSLRSRFQKKTKRLSSDHPITDDQITRSSCGPW